MLQLVDIRKIANLANYFEAPSGDISTRNASIVKPEAEAKNVWPQSDASGRHYATLIQNDIEEPKLPRAATYFLSCPLNVEVAALQIRFLRVRRRGLTGRKLSSTNIRNQYSRLAPVPSVPGSGDAPEYPVSRHEKRAAIPCGWVSGRAGP